MSRLRDRVTELEHRLEELNDAAGRVMSSRSRSLQPKIAADTLRLVANVEEGGKFTVVIERSSYDWFSSYGGAPIVIWTGVQSFTRTTLELAYAAAEKALTKMERDRRLVALRAQMTGTEAL